MRDIKIKIHVSVDQLFRDMSVVPVVLITKRVAHADMRAYADTRLLMQCFRTESGAWSMFTRQLLRSEQSPKISEEGITRNTVPASFSPEFWNEVGKLRTQVSIGGMVRIMKHVVSKFIKTDRSTSGNLQRRPTTQTHTVGRQSTPRIVTTYFV